MMARSHMDQQANMFWAPRLVSVLYSASMILRNDK